MKPVLVLQHMDTDGPGYLATWLREQGRPFAVFNSAAGQDFPASMNGFGALAVLGGEMSVNDELPSLRRAEALIRQSMARDLPVIGHCLGGQLMATALGARVAESPAPEIGWQRAAVHAHAQAREWFGEVDAVTVFHWHYEAFDLPREAVSLAGSAACPHQAFAIGRHLAMQFHVEVDEGKLALWSASRDPEFLQLQQSCPTVQSGEAMRAMAGRCLAAQQALAARLYARWLDDAG
ncbi:MAG: type 1 glutamine amidotransferase [Piscinibacter sp.]|uniref:type 1 glutamine amidotransferase n=1 Tax=Piscinibacter sp. TaxID=1903157 RepID=UPI003D0F07A1